LKYTTQYLKKNSILIKIIQQITFIGLFLGRAVVYLLLELIGFFYIFGNNRTDKKNKKVIAFQTHATHLAQFYYPVIKKLGSFKDIDVYFIIQYHPEYPFSEMAKLRKYALDKLGIDKEKILDYWQVTWMKFDLLIATYLYIKFPIIRTKKWLLRHGPGLYENSLQRSIKRKCIYDFDRVLLPGRYDYDILKAESAKLPPLEIVGFPYLDKMKSFNTKERYSYQKSLGLDRTKKTILLAPSWGSTHVYKESLSHYFRQIIDLLTSYSDDYNVLVKLHHCSFNQMMAKGVKWSQELQSLAAVIKIDQNVDDSPALQCSDLLITDFSSRAFNFMLLDKPVVLFVKLSGYVGKYGYRRIVKMLEGSYLAEDLEELRESIDLALLHPTEMSEKRKRVAEECFSYYGSSTEQMVRLIKDEFKL